MSKQFGIADWKTDEMVGQDDFRIATDKEKNTEYFVSRNDQNKIITLGFNKTESDSSLKLTIVR